MAVAMQRLILPNVVEIQLMAANRHGGSSPLPLADVIVSVRTFRCQKNDYHLGPFFSDAAGVVRITQEDLRDAIADGQAIGLMDYAEIEKCSPEIEIRHWSSTEVETAERSRREAWKSLLPGEARHYASIGELVHRIHGAANRGLKPSSAAIRDSWDGRLSSFRYAYEVESV